MPDMRPIPGFSLYEISSDGSVIVNVRSGKEMKSGLSRRGYLVIALRDDEGKPRKKGVHWFVAVAWIGPPPSAKHQVAHWNDVKTDNRKTNLRWATSKENHEDRKRNGLMPRGSNHGRARLREEDVLFIRADVFSPEGQLSWKKVEAAAARFGVCAGTVHFAAIGKTWTHVGSVAA